jgi:tRNA pseudouridine55 synthase
MSNLLFIDKPSGITSHDVVDRVRRMKGTRRVGHAGTLDPFATGLLIVGVGPGTKELTALVGLDKTYEAVARLGATSSTDDPEGVIVEAPLGARCIVPRTRNEIERIFNSFRGGYEQTAPAFSAKKIGGKKLYELARRGNMDGIVLPKKFVTMTELVILDYTWPLLRFRVSCSSGTYIRALARDIGNALGCGAYLTELRRTRIGEFRIDDAVRLEVLTTVSFLSFT